MKRKDEIQDIVQEYSLLDQAKDLWRFSCGNRYEMLFFLLVSLFASLLALLPPYLYGRIIDDLTARIFDNILFFLLATGLSYFLFRLLREWMVYRTKVLSAYIANESRMQTFKHLFALPLGFFEDHPMGMVLSRVTEGAKAVKQCVKVFYRSVIVRFLTAIFGLTFLFTARFEVGVYTATVLILYLLYSYHSSFSLLRLENEVHKESETAFAKIYDFFTRIQVVKLLNIQEKLIVRLDQALLQVVGKDSASRKYERIKVFFSELSTELASVALLGYFAYLVFLDTMSIGIAVMLYGFFMEVTSNTRTVWMEYHLSLTQRAAMYRMHLLLKVSPSISEPKRSRIPAKNAPIIFDKVSFSYEKKGFPLAIDTVSLTVQKGEKLAIVGLSGSGKSTLAKLLLKMYLPQKGAVSLGSVSVNDIHSKDLYDIIKIVPQENELINASIRENFELCVAQNLSEKEMLKGLALADALDFVQSLPQGIDTVIGPNGLKLSGGQKQRLCIARALLAKPQILVLDEATASLDVLTEKSIHESLHNLPKSITLLAITHRISSLHLFDRIIVMHEGRIVGEGKHRSLLSNPYYKQLRDAMKKKKS